MSSKDKTEVAVLFILFSVKGMKACLFEFNFNFQINDTKKLTHLKLNDWVDIENLKK